jgi:hypothetical protein
MRRFARRSVRDVDHRQASRTRGYSLDARFSRQIAREGEWALRVEDWVVGRQRVCVRRAAEVDPSTSSMSNTMKTAMAADGNKAATH